MIEIASAYSGFSVDDVEEARRFYSDTLGLEVRELVPGQMLSLILPGGGASVLLYGKPDHTPASFTVLNLVVDDIDVAVDALTAQGLEPDRSSPWADARGVMRGRSQNRGPDIAWFTDPAGNIFSVQQQ
ncbi:VOC family protein [Frigoribacterium sp. 2-23]|uniref:VOC family protein n=1 Tax=Frigoribacterium sp. 2-23 TaxID=3415006 RepID=UPI003C6F0BB6